MISVIVIFLDGHPLEGEPNYQHIKSATTNFFACMHIASFWEIGNFQILYN